MAKTKKNHVSDKIILGPIDHEGWRITVMMGKDAPLMVAIPPNAMAHHPTTEMSKTLEEKHSHTSWIVDAIEHDLISKEDKRLFFE